MFDFYRSSGNVENAKKYAQDFQILLQKEFSESDTLYILYYFNIASYYIEINDP